MGETRVRRTGKDELRHAELPDPPQALEFRRIEQFPRRLITPRVVPVLLKHDEAVDGVANALGTSVRHRWNIPGTHVPYQGQFRGISPALPEFQGYPLPQYDPPYGEAE